MHKQMVMHIASKGTGKKAHLCDDEGNAACGAKGDAHDLKPGDMTMVDCERCAYSYLGQNNKYRWVPGV